MELTIKGKKVKVDRIAGVYVREEPFVRVIADGEVYKIEGDLFKLGLEGIKKALK